MADDGIQWQKLEYYRDRRGKWRWRLRSGNGEIIAASSQGFVERRSARSNFELILRMPDGADGLRRFEKS